jgi:hypothetical protein
MGDRRGDGRHGRDSGFVPRERMLGRVERIDVHRRWDHGIDLHRTGDRVQ